MDWQNFYFGFFLWLTGSGILLTLFKNNSSSFSGQSKDEQKTPRLDQKNNFSTNNQKRIQQLEKQLEIQTNALNVAQSELEKLQTQLDSVSNSSAQDNRSSELRIIDLVRQIEVLQSELDTNAQQTQEQENKYERGQKKWQNQTATFSEQIEALQSELELTSDQLELTQNKYFNSQQDFEQQTTNYQERIDQLEAKNRSLVNKLEQLPTQLESNWQAESIELLNDLLISYPTAKLMVELKHNLPSKNIIALLKPLELLLQQWQIETIGQPWRKVTYNPNIHDCGEENISEGESVYVRWIGYYQGDRVLIPAKVSRKLPGQK